MEPNEAFKYHPITGNPLTKNSKGELVDKKTSHKFYINPQVGSSALIIKESQLLMILRGKNPQKGKLDVPGGFIEVGETAEQAVIREVKEELGANVDTVKYFTSQHGRYNYQGINNYSLGLFFIVTLKSYKNLIAADDAAEIKFFDINKIPLEQIGLDDVRKGVEEYLRQG